MLNRLHAQLVKNGPAFLRTPVKLIPFALKQQVIEQLLEWQFRQALEEGDLDFLDGRWLSIEVPDLGLQWLTSLANNKLIVRKSGQADVTFRANANALLLIAARKQDPDTLFFQRHLMIEGDTELGLYVKNLMDAIELEAMPKPLRIALFQLANFVETGLKYPPDPDSNSIGEPC